MDLDTLQTLLGWCLVLGYGLIFALGLHTSIFTAPIVLVWCLVSVSLLLRLAPLSGAASGRVCRPPLPCVA